MTLAERLAVVMVGLVVSTALVVGWLTYNNLEAVIVPAELARLEDDAANVATMLDRDIRNTSDDVRGIAETAALAGIVRARLAGGMDPEGGIPERTWRERMANHFAARLAAKNLYLQFRIIETGGEGREILRVDHSGPNGTIRNVPDAELQSPGHPEYYQAALELAAGEVYISRPDLNIEDGRIDMLRGPVVDVVTPVFSAQRERFGIVIMSLDLQTVFSHLPRSHRPGSAVYVVNDAGEFIIHPDPSRGFDAEPGTAFTLEQEFASLSGLVGSSERRTSIVHSSAGQNLFGAFVPVLLAGGPWVGVIETIPEQEVLRTANSVRRASLIGGAAVALVAGLIALWLARSLARPIGQMTSAVESFYGENAVALPKTPPTGELKRLSAAFIRMSAAVRERAESLRREIEVRREAESRAERHAESARLLSAVVESSDDAIIAVDLSGTITAWNRAAENVYGYRAEEAIGQNVAMLVPPELQIEAAENLAKVARGERLHPHETTRLTRDGKAVDVSLTISPVRSPDGTIVGVSKIARDITEARKLAEHLRTAQKLEAIGTLTGGIAHDFNNILAAIMGNIELIGTGSHPEIANELKEIELATRRATELVRRILTFSRRQPTEQRPVALTPVVKEALHLLRASLPAMIEFRIELAEDLPAVLADATQIHQIVMNLVTNASHAMGQQGVIEVRLATMDVDPELTVRVPDLHVGRYVRLDVSDNGPGMDADTAARIFEPFFTTKAPGEGTGLGLSMVHGIMRAHGGAIAVFSQPGKGTIFHLYFPVADGAASSGDPRPATLLRGSGERILFVDDELPLVRVGSLLLETLGYRVAGHRRSEDALAAFAKAPAAFDLVISDMSMPRITGPELAQRILEIRPDVPMVLMSGYFSPTDLSRIQSLGINELLSKPPTMETFSAAIHRALHRRSGPG